MNIDGKPYRTIWLHDDGQGVMIIDQDEAARMRSRPCVSTRWSRPPTPFLTMQVRGAPLIGATAAYGVALAMGEDPSDDGLQRAAAHLAKQRPTAINLRWALDEMVRVLGAASGRSAAVQGLCAGAAEIADEDVETCRKIGVHGLDVIKAIQAKKGPGRRSTFSPIAMRDGSPASIGGRPPRPSNSA